MVRTSGWCCYQDTLCSSCAIRFCQIRSCGWICRQLHVDITVTCATGHFEVQIACTSWDCEGVLYLSASRTSKTTRDILSQYNRARRWRCSAASTSYANTCKCRSNVSYCISACDCKKSMAIEEIIVIGITAASVFAILDTFAPQIGVAARQGVGMSVGVGLTGGLPLR